jgi:hypothetical protein
MLLGILPLLSERVGVAGIQALGGAVGPASSPAREGADKQYEDADAKDQHSWDDDVVHPPHSDHLNLADYLERCPAGLAPNNG